MSVYGFQLINGQDIIGEVVGLDDSSASTFRLEKPAAVTMMPGNDGRQMGVGLMPWIPYADEDSFDVPKRNVVVWYKPSVDLLNHYNRMFGSGIVLATTPLK